MSRHNYSATAENIAALNELPNEQLRFSDFARLKSGRDCLSGCRLTKLQTMVSNFVWEGVSREFEHDSDRAACLRWNLRGLDPDKAIRKTKTDREITANAIAAVRASRLAG